MDLQPQVSSAAILSMVATLVLSVGVPIAVLIVLSIKRKGAAGAFFAGMLGYFVPQMIIRTPILQALSRTDGYAAFVNQYTVPVLVVLALTAGLFETTGRLLVFTLVLKNRRGYFDGLAAGAGHGAIESIGLVGVTYFNNLTLSILINSGDLSALYSALPQETADDIVAVMTGTAPAMFLASGVERVLTMAFHTAMSVLLLLFIVKGATALGFLLVTGIHAALDFVVPMLSLSGVNIWITEGALAVVALVCIYLLIKLKDRIPDSPPVLTGALPGSY